MMRKFALLLLAPLLLAAGDPATETEHVVAEGETLGGIANRAGVPLGVIAGANGLVEPYSVRLGQRLAIPRQRVHVVSSGDSGLGIANRYGIPFSNIAIANGLQPPYNIRIGQRLIIPAVIAAPTNPMPARTRPYFRAPHDGEVLFGYAMRPDRAGGFRGHDGIDYAANVGDMVRASASGTVSFAGNEPTRFGRLVVIDHGNGWQTAYGHLASLTVAEGEYVKTGERIGLAGDAGVATRIELHFEMRKDGDKVDPAPLLARGARP